MPFTAAWPSEVIVQVLPFASVIAADAPAATPVSFGEAVGTEVEVGGVEDDEPRLPGAEDAGNCTRYSTAEGYEAPEAWSCA